MDHMYILGAGLQHSHSLLISHWDNQFLAAERKVAGGLIGKTRYSPHIAAGLLEGIDHNIYIQGPGSRPGLAHKGGSVIHQAERQKKLCTTVGVCGNSSWK